MYERIAKYCEELEELRMESISEVKNLDVMRKELEFEGKLTKSMESYFGNLQNVFIGKAIAYEKSVIIIQTMMSTQQPIADIEDMIQFGKENIKEIVEEMV